jgi:hypothetical protein
MSGEGARRATRTAELHYVTDLSSLREVPGAALDEAAPFILLIDWPPEPQPLSPVASPFQ